MPAEQKRLDENHQVQASWKHWGPYLSERQWGTVRVDCSDAGNAWNYFSHDQARSRDGHLHDLREARWRSRAARLLDLRSGSDRFPPGEEREVETMTKMIEAFELSTQKNPLIAPGTPDPYTPPK